MSECASSNYGFQTASIPVKPATPVETMVVSEQKRICVHQETPDGHKKNLTDL